MLVPITHTEVLALRSRMAWFRNKNYKLLWQTIVGVEDYSKSGEYRYSLEHGGMTVRYDDFVRNYEYSLDDGLTWLSMMKEVE